MNNRRAQYLKIAIALSVALNLLLVGRLLMKRMQTPPAQSGTAQNFRDVWDGVRNDIYSRCRIDSGDVVFLGNSHTEAMLVAENFGARAKNRGIGANTTHHILKRVGQIARTKPSVMLMEMGINDVLEHYPKHVTLQNISSIIDTIQTHSPKTRILFTSLFPTNGKYLEFQDSIPDMNLAIQQLCTNKRIEFINMYPNYLKGAGLDSSLSYDGLHLNGRGYEIWIDSLKSKMQDSEDKQKLAAVEPKP